MILSKAKIKDIAKGVIYWSDGPEGGLIPHRFCQAQEAEYLSNEAFTLRTRATSGVRLECRTDASALKVSFRAFAGSAKDWYGFDLVIDGVLFGHFEGTLQETDRIHWAQPLPAGEKTLQLYLPCLTGVEILNVDLQGATCCECVEYTEKILVMGDSVTQGYSSRFPSMTYVAQMAAYRHADFINQAIGGEMFHPEIITPLDWQPTMALISYGGNDWAFKDRQRTADDCTAFLERFHGFYPELPTVVLTPKWGLSRPAARMNDDFSREDVAGIIRNVAARYSNMRTVSGLDLFPQIKELMADVAHPTELGFIFFAKRLCDAMDKLTF